MKASTLLTLLTVFTTTALATESVMKCNSDTAESARKALAACAHGDQKELACICAQRKEFEELVNKSKEECDELPATVEYIIQALSNCK